MDSDQNIIDYIERALNERKVFNLSNNKITEIKGLENLVNLERFSISNNQIPEEIENKIGYSAQNYVRYYQQKKEN